MDKVVHISTQRHFEIEISLGRMLFKFAFEWILTTVQFIQAFSSVWVEVNCELSSAGLSLFIVIDILTTGHLFNLSKRKLLTQNVSCFLINICKIKPDFSPKKRQVEMKVGSRKTLQHPQGKLVPTAEAQASYLSLLFLFLSGSAVTFRIFLAVTEVWLNWLPCCG